MKKCIIFFSFFLILLSPQLYSYIKLPDVIVVGSKTGGGPTRDVSVYDSSDIMLQSPYTVDSLVESISPVYVKNRGPAGVQQDISILGSSYEQTLFLLDGMPINDPQTGHFNMNIPVSPLGIRRMEMLAGHGSVSHGSGAIGGVINIVPGREEFDNKLMLYAGSYSTIGSELVSSRKYGKLENMMSVSLRRTDDYHPQTDSAVVNIFNASRYGRLKFNAAYMNKEFGAFDFYTPGWNMPSREWNEVFLISSSYEEELSNTVIIPRVMWRRHIDRYVLKADDPAFYENNHINDIVTAQINVKLKNIICGSELRNEYLDSSSMGDHSRQIVSVFSELTYNLHEDVLLSAGARYEDIVVPRISFAWWAAEDIKLRTAWGKSYRRPTFTELYYSSPANQGNKDLESETSDNYEIGSDISISKKIELKLTYFNRILRDMIDWAGDTPAGPWKADNIGKQNINSVNSSIGYKIADNIKKTIGYSYTDIKKEKKYYSKYALKYLRHRINFLSEISINKSISLITSGEWGVPTQRNKESFGIVNLMLKKNIERIQVFIKFENIGNSNYSDISGVPEPGRWFTAGIIW
ncbi:TonB-dependent receptor plug domain-containing protein [Elusimicrobiota bacterium]